jgi:hypothetical protein
MSSTIPNLLACVQEIQEQFHLGNRKMVEDGLTFLRSIYPQHKDLFTPELVEQLRRIVLDVKQLAEPLPDEVEDEETEKPQRHRFHRYFSSDDHDSAYHGKLIAWQTPFDDFTPGLD